MLDGARPVDFRPLLEALVPHIVPLDPADPRARRLPSGLALTADGWEAELVTPALPSHQRAWQAAADMVAEERRRLESELSAHLDEPRTQGFSTHINVSVDDAEVVEVAREFARRCAPAVMAVTELPDSPGLLVRARRGRLEVGTEYVDGARLVAAVAAVTEGVQALRSPERRPPVVVRELQPAREKFGWFVPAHGRSRLPLGELAPVRAADSAGVEPPAAQVDTRARLVQGTWAETSWLTWSLAAWSLTDCSTGAQRTAVVHVDQEAAFLHALDDGMLTPFLRESYRQRRPSRLLVHADALPAAIWHEVRPGALVPAERDLRGALPRVRRRAALRQLRRSPGDALAGSRSTAHRDRAAIAVS